MATTLAAGMPALWICLIAAAAGLVLFAAGLLAGRAQGRKAAEAEFKNRSMRRYADAVAEGDENPEVVRDNPEVPKTALVINPSKNDSDRARKLVRLGCALRGWPAPIVLETTEDDPGEGMARKALELGCSLIVVGGGDGTVREVSKVLAEASEEYNHASMGIVPLGTGNLLARNLGLNVSKLDPKAMEACVDIALEGTLRTIDTAKIRAVDASGGTHEDMYLVMGGIGLDAEVIAATDDDLKKRVGWLAYTDAGMRLLAGGKRKTVELSVDEGPFHKAKIRSILFANLGKIPGGLEFVPGAEVDDGKLTVVTMSPRNLLGWGWIALKTVVRAKNQIPVISYQSARSLTLRSHEPLGTQLDGDLFIEATELTTWILPSSLRLHVPAENPGRFGFLG